MHYWSNAKYMHKLEIVIILFKKSSGIGVLANHICVLKKWAEEEII